MSQDQPGAQFPADAESVIADLRAEVGHLSGVIAMQRSQLRSADRKVAELRDQLSEAANIASEATAAAEALHANQDAHSLTST